MNKASHLHEQPTGLPYLPTNARSFARYRDRLGTEPRLGRPLSRLRRAAGVGGLGPGGGGRGQHPEAAGGRASGERLCVGSVRTATRIAWGRRRAAPAPELMIVGPRRSLLDL